MSVAVALTTMAVEMASGAKTASVPTLQIVEGCRRVITEPTTPAANSSNAETPSAQTGWRARHVHPSDWPNVPMSRGALASRRRRQLHSLGLGLPLLHDAQISGRHRPQVSHSDRFR